MMTHPSVNTAHSKQYLLSPGDLRNEIPSVSSRLKPWSEVVLVTHFPDFSQQWTLLSRHYWWGLGSCCRNPPQLPSLPRSSVFARASSDNGGTSSKEDLRQAFLVNVWKEHDLSENYERKLRGKNQLIWVLKVFKIIFFEATLCVFIHWLYFKITF